MKDQSGLHIGRLFFAFRHHTSLFLPYNKPCPTSPDLNMPVTPLPRFIPDLNSFHNPSLGFFFSSIFLRGRQSTPRFEVHLRLLQQSKCLQNGAVLLAQVSAALPCQHRLPVHLPRDERGTGQDHIPEHSARSPRRQVSLDEKQGCMYSYNEWLNVYSNAFVNWENVKARQRSEAT